MSSSDKSPWTNGGGVSSCSTPETPRVQGSSSAGPEGDPKNCISSKFLRGANAHGPGPRSDHGFYRADYLQSFLHRLRCWLSGCDELIRQQQDKTKFSAPCYSCILINICFLLGSLEKKNLLMCIFVTLSEMSLMQKFIQLPNISCVVTKGFPPFSNLSTVSFSSSMWFKQVFLSLWHLAGCTGSDSLIFSHTFPSESWGLRAWGLFGALGISDNLNCSSSSLRWKSGNFLEIVKLNERIH